MIFNRACCKRRKAPPLLLVNTTSRLEDDQIIECTTSYYRADRYEFSTTDRYYD